MTELSFKPIAIETTRADTRDRVFIRDLSLFAHHGVFEAEQQLGQDFHFDIEAVLSSNGPWLADDPDEVVRYDHICEEVAKLVQGQRVKLIETLAEKIAARLFEVFPKIAALRIAIRKPQAAIPYKLESVGVEIIRTRPSL